MSDGTDWWGTEEELREVREMAQATNESNDVVMKPSPYPEHDKLSSVSKRSQEIGQFLEWLTTEREPTAQLCRLIDLTDSVGGYYPEHQYVTLRLSIQEILAEYFGIDLNVIEQEKRDMIKAIREHRNG